jgi:FlaA1/EpsC-like NDP-sugar epimerase
MRAQIRRQQPVTVTDPRMTRFFMTIPEAVQLVIQAGALGQAGELFLLDMGQPVNILELAQDLIRLSGLVPYRDIPIRIIGARPGERLHEEILTQDEGIAVTRHERIFKAPATPPEPGLVQRLTAGLLEAAERQDRSAMVDALRALVPTFVPSAALASPGPVEGTVAEAEQVTEQTCPSLSPPIPRLDAPPRAA